tara:strand:+ start:822 stop:923 length:102 start_codon:yes stop_codon:yes gene_type:complete
MNQGLSVGGELLRVQVIAVGGIDASMMATRAGD